MTVVFDIEPVLWPAMNPSRISNYFTVACSIMVVYDWVLTFGQEFELVWRQRWSLMTVIYLSVRYIGIIFSVASMGMQLISMTDAACLDTYLIINYVDITAPALLGVIIIAQLYAMYQRSRKMLVFLVVTFVAIEITIGVNTLSDAVQNVRMFGNEFAPSGVHMCTYVWSGFINESWILVLGTAWQILALCLAGLVAVKHFRELHAASMRWTVTDCFTILIKTHIFYFISFAFQLSYFPQQFSNSLSPGAQNLLGGGCQIAHVMQMFILGPRLILGIREYHAKLVANCDDGSNMTSIVFQERVHISTGASV